MQRQRVLPDVLPDLAPRLGTGLDENDFHETIIWTEDLLDELARVWIDHGARSAEAAAKVCRDIRDAFVGQDVPRHEYEHLIGAMPGGDPDDHAHAAAAASSRRTRRTSRPRRSPAV